MSQERQAVIVALAVALGATAFVALGGGVAAKPPGPPTDAPLGIVGDGGSNELARPGRRGARRRTVPGELLVADTRTGRFLARRPFSIPQACVRASAVTPDGFAVLVSGSKGGPPRLALLDDRSVGAVAAPGAISNCSTRPSSVSHDARRGRGRSRATPDGRARVIGCTDGWHVVNGEGCRTAARPRAIASSRQPLRASRVRAGSARQQSRLAQPRAQRPALGPPGARGCDGLTFCHSVSSLSHMGQPKRRSQFVALAGSRGSITLPAEVRRRYHLDEPGAQVEVIGRSDGVIELHPVLPHRAEQAWFWTERWQAMEREAEEDIAAGRTRVFDSAEEFIADLDREAAERGLR